MVTKESYEAIDQIFRIYSTMSSRKPKDNVVPSLTYYASPNPSLSGISPTILNLKRDLERLYKPRSRAFINATSHNIAKETESYHRALERL